MNEPEPRSVDLTAPEPLTGLPPSVVFDAIEAMQAANEGRLGLTSSGAYAAIRSHKVNEARHRFFDPALTNQLYMRGLIKNPQTLAPWSGKVRLTDKGKEALPFLLVWAGLVRAEPSPLEGQLNAIQRKIDEKLAEQLCRPSRRLKP